MITDIEIKKAKWVTAPERFASPVIIRQFIADAGDSAKIAISALGFFTVFVNGKRVGDEYFLPANSIVCAREGKDWIYPITDKFTYRCYYSVYDLTPYLSGGENTLEVALGDGWYRQKEHVSEGTMTYGDALGTIFALSLTGKNGERMIYSDGGELCRDSATVYSQLFAGEIYDARIRASGKYEYAPVSIKSLPDTELTENDSVPDRIIRRIKPTLLFSDGGRKVYDAGENISGFVTLSSSAAEGEEVRLRFAENIRDGVLDFGSTGADWKNKSGHSQLMEDIFIGDGTPHIFEPMFVWHAFRYFEVIGDGEAVSVAVVHSDTPVIADFKSDNEVLNWLFSSYIRTQLNNMHAGVPSDCPHRERLGYTGDGQACAGTAMTFLSTYEFYRKWMRDIFDSQDREGGHVNHTAPFYGGGGGPGGWGCAAVLVPYAFYKHYGDTSVLSEYYEGMKKWIGYLESRRENGLVVREEDGGWCLGDWCTLDRVEIPIPYVNTCYLIKSLLCLEEIAKLTGHTGDLGYYEKLRLGASEAVMTAYYDDESGSFCGGVQGADAFALYAGLGDERTFANLVRKYREIGHFDTGFLCTEILTGLLFEHGEADLAFALLSSREKGSFGYMMDHGATTIWERWDGIASHDHPMFGACAKYLVSGFLGITQTEDSVGFDNTVIAPKIPSGLGYAEGFAEIGGRKYSVKWKKETEGIVFDIEIPESCDFRFMQTEIKLCRGYNHFVLDAKD